jgi:biotin operon repressor
MVCLGHHAFCCGAKLWEEKHPEVAQALWKLAASHSQQDPTFRTTLSFTRLTAKEAIKQLQAQGFVGDVLPSRSGMSDVLNRNGYRLRPVIKAKPQKKSRKPTPSSPISRPMTELAKAKPSCA